MGKERVDSGGEKGADGTNAFIVAIGRGCMVIYVLWRTQRHLVHCDPCVVHERFEGEWLLIAFLCIAEHDRRLVWCGLVWCGAEGGLPPGCGMNRT